MELRVHFQGGLATWSVKSIPQGWKLWEFLSMSRDYFEKVHKVEIVSTAENES